MREEKFYQNKIFKFLLFIAILVACWFSGRFFKIDLDYYREVLFRYPVAISGLIFIIMYVVITFFAWFGPKDVFRVGGAMLFGAYISTVLVWIAEMFNAVILFQLSRRLGQKFVEQKLRIKSKGLNKFKKRSGFLWAVALRNNPLVPFRFLDLGAGLSQIFFRKYFYASLIASPLRILWLQYILAEVGENFLKEPLIIINYLSENANIIRFSSFYFLTVIILSVLAAVERFVKKE